VQVLSPAAAASLVVVEYSSPVRPAEGRRLGDELSAKKSEVQVFSPAGSFLRVEGGCGAGVEPGRSIPSSAQEQLSSAIS
jgi:hypothetical protein